MPQTKKKGRAEAQPTSKNTSTDSSTRPLYLPLRWVDAIPAAARKAAGQ